jgi:hypothetical protein
MVVCKARDYQVFELCPSSGILNNSIFWRLDLFPSLGQEVQDTLLSPSERPNRPVMDKVEKFDNPT